MSPTQNPQTRPAVDWWCDHAPCKEQQAAFVSSLWNEINSAIHDRNRTSWAKTSMPFNPIIVYTLAFPTGMLRRAALDARISVDPKDWPHSCQMLIYHDRIDVQAGADKPITRIWTREK